MEINNKYNLGQEVIVLFDKKIVKSTIYEIKIIVKSPYSIIDQKDYFKIKPKSGISIQYSILIPTNNPNMQANEWYDEEDVFTDRKELLARILDI